MDKGIDLSACLLLNFFAHRVIACGGVSITNLVNPPVTGALTDLPGGFNHILCHLLGNLSVLAPDQSYMSAEGPHCSYLLFAEGIGSNDLKRIAFRRAHKRQ